MTRATSTRRRAIGRGWPILVLLLVTVPVMTASGAAPAGGGSSIKTGAYRGKTTQEAVGSAFRSIRFTVKKGKVTLTQEPSVALGSCVSTPVFTIDGSPTKKLGRDRTFTFTRTFLGSKFDKIHGRFVSPDEVEGYALYHFSAQDLCSGSRSKVNFTAKHR